MISSSECEPTFLLVPTFTPNPSGRGIDNLKFDLLLLLLVLRFFFDFIYCINIFFYTFSVAPEDGGGVA